MPDVQVDLWPMEGAVPKDGRMQKVVGSDVFTTARRGAVDTCIRIAHETPSTEMPEVPAGGSVLAMGDSGAARARRPTPASSPVR